jgi:hypothetical protein
VEIVLALGIVIGATAGILNIGRFAERSPFSVSSLPYINNQLKYQALLLGLAALVLVTVYFINPANFLTFLALGSVAAPATGVSWLGISEGESWFNLALA